MISIMTRMSANRLATVKDLYAHLIRFRETESDDEIMIIRDLAESSRDDNKRKKNYWAACNTLVDTARRCLEAEPFGDFRDDMGTYHVLLKAIYDVDMAMQL